MTSQQQRLRYGLIVLLSLAVWAAAGEAHRSGCRRWRSCPSDSGTYVCGDLGYCAQCPDNEFCRGGQPRTAASPPAIPVPAPAKPPAPAPLQTQAAKVARVIDGDTLQLSTGQEVHLIGVDTPETKHLRKPVEPFGQEAKAFTRRLAEGQEVRLEFDVQRRDKYGRTLAYVYVGTTMLNAELVRQGYAQVATFPPNVRHQERFLAPQRQAREARRGLWGP